MLYTGSRNYSICNLELDSEARLWSGSGIRYGRVSRSAASGFYTVTPCRVLDTRASGGALAAGGTLPVQVVGGCGIPAGASAVSVNVTVVGATAGGQMTAFPTGEPRPGTSVISFPAAVTRANNAVLKLGDGSLSFFNGQTSGAAHLVIDVNGYFHEGT
jgi:hypothetical protein